MWEAGQQGEGSPSCGPKQLTRQTVREVNASPGTDLNLIPKVIAGNPMSPHALWLTPANFILATTQLGGLCFRALQTSACQFSSATALSAADDWDGLGAQGRVGCP